jgi:hypothetical protein
VRGKDEMQNHPDGGAFPRTVRSKKAEDVSLPDLDIQMIHRQPVFVSLRQIKGAKNYIRHGAVCPFDSSLGYRRHKKTEYHDSICQ